MDLATMMAQVGELGAAVAELRTAIHVTDVVPDVAVVHAAAQSVAQLERQVDSLSNRVAELQAALRLREGQLLEICDQARATMVLLSQLSSTPPGHLPSAVEVAPASPIPPPPPPPPPPGPPLA